MTAIIYPSASEESIGSNSSDQSTIESESHRIAGDQYQLAVQLLYSPMPADQDRANAAIALLAVAAAYGHQNARKLHDFQMACWRNDAQSTNGMGIVGMVSQAERGHHRSMFTLGVAYYTGLGIRKDYGKALYWLTQYWRHEYPKVRNTMRELGIENAELPNCLAYAARLLSDVHTQGAELIGRDLVSAAAWSFLAGSKGQMMSLHLKSQLPALELQRAITLAEELKCPERGLS